MLGLGALARGAQAGGLRTWSTARGWDRGRLAERQRGGSLHWGAARAKVTKVQRPLPRSRHTSTTGRDQGGDQLTVIAPRQLSIQAGSCYRIRARPS